MASSTKESRTHQNEGAQIEDNKSVENNENPTPFSDCNTEQSLSPPSTPESDVSPNFKSESVSSCNNAAQSSSAEGEGRL